MSSKPARNARSTKIVITGGVTSRFRMVLTGRHIGLETALATIFYFFFACYLTWPLVTDLSHIIYGAAGDSYGTMAFYRELVDHHHNPFLPGTMSQFSAPEGQAVPWPRDLASMPGVLTQFLLTAILGYVTANGVYILLGYTLTGIVTFLFVRRLTGNTWASLIGGWALAFYPFAVINGQGHSDYIQTWVLVLGIWRMLELMWHPSRRNGIFAGIAVVFGMWWSPYFILFGGVSYVVIATVALAISWREGNLSTTVRPQVITATIVTVFIAVLAILSTVGAAEGIGVRTQSMLALNTYSARALEYVVPDSQSPLFGGDTRGYLTNHIHGSNAAEATLYVGITVILLALAAFWTTVRRRLPSSLGKGALALSAVAVAALITSAPPQGRIFGVLVPFPSHFISGVTSTWRVYSRFVMVVMVALSALAAIGLHVLTCGRSKRVKITIMLLATVLVPVDLWARLGGRTNKIAVPGIYRTLAREPTGLVAEYPLTPYGTNTYNDLFFQNVHSDPMINGYYEGSPEERRALSLANISELSTASRLASLGVRYVLLESTPPGYGLPLSGRPGRGFRLIASEPYGSLYLVVARPSAPALAAVGVGFAATESGPAGPYNWLEQSSGAINVAGSCVHCRGLLTMTVLSFARPRTVTIVSAGRVLARKLVVGPTPLSVPLDFRRQITVKLTATPDPQSISKTTGSSDPRNVSVQVSNVSFVALPRSGVNHTRRSVNAGGTQT